MINARTYMKRDNYIDRLIHTMWNGEIKVLIMEICMHTL